LRGIIGGWKAEIGDKSEEKKMSIENEITDEAKKLLPQIYADVAQPAVKEIGSVLGRSVKALLTPLRGFLWGREQIERIVIEGVEKRLESRPEENMKTPDPEIAVPVIQALSYTAQNETLREMYLNLLANSMDKSQDKNVHPSFVEIIRQMNTLDARLFKILSPITGYLSAINPSINIIGENKFLVNKTPEWFIDVSINGYDAFDISASLVRLGRLGIIELMYDRTAGKGRSEELKKSPLLLSVLKKCQSEHPDLQLEIGTTDSLIHINEFGKQFARSCL
jgi:hypothetical protein